MKTQNIAQMKAEIDAHRAADRLVQGLYFDAATGRGCFIGCLAHDDDAAVIAERYGVPETLTRLLESIFDRLPFDEAAEFFSEIPRAIGRDGRDLTRVHWAFLADLLRHLPDTDARDVVAAGMDLLAAGKEWPGAAEAMARAWSAAEAEAEAEAVTWSAAYWAAEAVARASEASEASEAAVRAAEASEAAGAKETRRQRDAILRLIREA